MTNNIDTPMYGYIYIRDNTSYIVDGVYKLGKASNIPDRDSVYATSELNRGEFVMVIAVPIKQMGIIENLLQYEFKQLGLHIQKDGGTEFFKREIIILIIPYLQKLNTIFKVLSKIEISKLVRMNRIRQLKIAINRSGFIQKLKNRVNRIRNLLLDNVVNDGQNINQPLIEYSPRDYQTVIINNSVVHYQENDKGMLILMCGVGKTLISLWITKELNSQTILIGVPNILLLNQWRDVIRILFPDVPCLVVAGNVKEEHIIVFLQKNQGKCIVITTYASSQKVHNATEQIYFNFDMKILDECHHLCSHNKKKAEESKSYIKILNIPSTKQISLTATLKQIENIDNCEVISNDNIDYFGEIIDRKCLLWAIQENIICDYEIQTLITDEDKLEEFFLKFNITEENDKRLFLSAYAGLKSISDGISHHITMFSNDTDNSEKLIEYINMLIENKYFDIPDLFRSNYYGEMNSKVQTQIISDFKKSKYGIITCVYCLGEGWDFPLLDAVVFCENMSSNIRIVQSALRASRKNKEEPNKKTKIILPILNKCDWLDNSDNVDFKKVREVIYQMGLEDETITQKIKVYKMGVEKQEPMSKELEIKNIDEVRDYEYIDELTQKIRFKTNKRTSLATSYEKARKIISDKNIKSKEGYFELCKKDNRLSEYPETAFFGKFTNWIEYLSIERVYYDLDTTKNKVIELLVLYPILKQYYLDLSQVCYELCKLDNNFPPNDFWVEYYKNDNVKELQDIIIINAIQKKKKSSII